MAIFWATVIPIIFVGTILYVIFKIRRASEERRQRSSEREAALLANLQKSAANASGGPSDIARPPLERGADAAHPTTSAPSVSAASAPRPQTSAATQATYPAAALTRRARILTDAQRLLFLVLRAAMPDHLIMAHVRIVDLLDLPNVVEAGEGDVRLRALARQRLDFVVCDADLVPVAAIVLYEAGIAQVPDETIKIDALRAIGIRFLRFRADSLPRPVEARSLVLA